MIIIGVIGLVYKFVVEPWIRGDLVKETSTQRYAHTIKDSTRLISGVCDPTFSCRSEPPWIVKGLNLRLLTTKPITSVGHAALKSGKVQMAVFTIDAYLKAGSEIGEFPGSIVLVIDESKGADAIVAYKRGVSTNTEFEQPAGAHCADSRFAE